MSLIVTQVSARMIAQSLCIQSFEASIAWAQKFPRGNGIPSSVKFRGQATAKLSEWHREGIDEIKSIAIQY